MAVNQDSVPNDLIAHLDKLHTTELGAIRIQKNLSFGNTADVVGWCSGQIRNPGSEIRRQGKNWYITGGGCIITVNAYSYTIITAHKLKGHNSFPLRANARNR